MSHVSPGNILAGRLFEGIAHDYERPAQLFSLFQYRRWRRFLVSQLNTRPGALVLDVCTGPGGVALSIAEKAGARVLGLDLSGPMLAQAQRRIDAAGRTANISLVKARAEDLPFASGSFDGVVFTFLLRYVEDPQQTLIELARVLRPGGALASLEFYVPRGPLWGPLWLLHTRLLLPVGTRCMSPGWREVGAFLGPSISSFYRRHTLRELEGMWAQAGICNVQTRVLSVGGAVVTWGTKADGHGA